jgi:hypothetical protein
MMNPNWFFMPVTITLLGRANAAAKMVRPSPLKAGLTHGGAAVEIHYFAPQTGTILREE